MSTTLPMDADARVEAKDASALVWWTQVPALPGERLGAIGGFQAATRAGAEEVLAKAVALLRAQGCTRAVGPMDGNTWRKYRLVTEGTETPPFFLEPANPPEWPGWWEAAQFAPLASYYSAMTDDLEPRDPRLPELAAKVHAAGITLRPLDLAQFDAELDRIYEVSVVAFQSNYLYTPLPRADFVAQYRAVRPLIRPELVCFAERAGRPIGYMFAIPDQAQAQRGGTVTNVIMKTIAVLPEAAGAGLGSVLFGEVHAAARRMGFTRAIHALMHEDNRSRRMSAHAGRIIRRYTLYSRSLVS